MDENNGQLIEILSTKSQKTQEKIKRIQRKSKKTTANAKYYLVYQSLPSHFNFHVNANTGLSFHFLCTDTGVLLNFCVKIEALFWSIFAKNMADFLKKYYNIFHIIEKYCQQNRKTQGKSKKTTENKKKSKN